MSCPKHNPILGPVLVAHAPGPLCVWIPLDTDSGYIQKVRRQAMIGDAAAPPALAALFLLLGGGGIAMVERRLTPCAVPLALVIAIAVMLVHDLPFDDLLLPSNGDV